MNIVDVIAAKRDNKPLTDEQIAFFVSGVTDGSVTDYQASALLMAIVLRGMDKRETLTLTRCMAQSGDMLDSARLAGSCDKHSTGGVGDKTTLIVAPLVAACGLKVAKISGRGLGHTGGTVDKLYAVEGVDIDLTKQRFYDIVDSVGVCVAMQTEGLVPADKKLYALRDVTATVDSLPLIVSSIMSKKLAAGAQNIVLDVKCGDGAFMKTERDAKRLARMMVDIGKAAGRGVAALITDMNNPLGNNIGNALEVEEALEVLRGTKRGALRQVSVELAAYALNLGGAGSLKQCRTAAEAALDSGEALNKFTEMLQALGAQMPLKLKPLSPLSRTVAADSTGFVALMEAEALGHACVALGAGRRKKTDDIDYGAGIVLSKQAGDSVREGETLLTMYANSENRLDEAERLLQGRLHISAEPPQPCRTVLAVVK